MSKILIDGGSSINAISHRAAGILDHKWHIEEAIYLKTANGREKVLSHFQHIAVQVAGVKKWKDCYMIVSDTIYHISLG